VVCKCEQGQRLLWDHSIGWAIVPLHQTDGNLALAISSTIPSWRGQAVRHGGGSMSTTCSVTLGARDSLPSPWPTRSLPSRRGWLQMASSKNGETSSPASPDPGFRTEQWRKRPQMNALSFRNPDFKIKPAGVWMVRSWQADTGYRCLYCAAPQTHGT